MHTLGNRIKKSHSPGQTLFLLKSHEERRLRRRAVQMGLFHPFPALDVWGIFEMIHAEIQSKLDDLRALDGDGRGRPRILEPEENERPFHPDMGSRHGSGGSGKLFEPYRKEYTTEDFSHGCAIDTGNANGRYGIIPSVDPEMSQTCPHWHNATVVQKRMEA